MIRHPSEYPTLVPTLGANKILGNPVEPKVWPTLREKLEQKK